MKVLHHFLVLLLLLIVTKVSYADQFLEKADSLTAKFYLNHADSLYQSNFYDSAAFYYDKAACEFIQLENWAKAYHSEVWETYMYLDLSNYEKAIANMDEAIDIFDDALSTNNMFSFSCSVKKSIAYFQQGKYLKAIQILDNALPGFLVNPDSKIDNGEKKLADAYFEYGNNYIETGKLDSAKIMFEKTLEIRERLYEKNHELIIDCYNNFGIVYAYFEDYEMAEVYMQKALKSREEKYGFAHSLTAWSYTNLGILNLYIGNYEKALEYDFKGLESRKQCLSDNHIDLASSYSVIANVYNEKGDYKEAQKYHNLALDIYLIKFGEDNIYISSMYNNMADNYNKQEEYEKALVYFLKSLSILNKISPDNTLPNHVLCMSNIADTYFKLGKLDSALYYNALSLKGNYAPVQQTQNINDLLDFEFAFVALESKAEIYFSKYRQSKKHEFLREAFNTYLEYIDLLDYLRNRAAGVDSKLLLSHLNSSVMDKAINTAFLLTQIEPSTYSEKDVTCLVEKNKANVLQEMLDKTDIQLEFNIPDSLIGKQGNISNAVIALKAEKMLLEEEGEDASLKEIEEQLFNLQKQLSDINNQIHTISPDYEKSMMGSFSGNNESLIIDEHTAILDYYVSDTLLYICFIDSKQTKVRTVPIDSTLEENTNQYIKCIKKNRLNSFSSLSYRLYSILIGPIEDLIQENNKLVIIPDKFLYYLPFETLCSNSSNKDFKDKNYLIKDYDILYHYSATIFCDLQKDVKSRSNQEMSFVGFAPVFDNDSISVEISDETFASLADTNIIAQTEILRSVSLNGKTYNTLPYSKEEVNSIAKLFREKNHMADTYLYSKASEPGFKRVCEKYKYVHIASHAIIFEDKPQVSGIIFSGNNHNSTPDSTTENINYSSDGILLTGEMYNLNLNADLVVLSACETGLGSYVRGEGVMSMARGLMYSGTPNVLFSLWKVGDRNTYQLMVEFYESLLNGSTYSDAIRKSKLKLIANEETAFPRFWSGFILLGAD